MSNKYEPLAKIFCDTDDAQLWDDDERIPWEKLSLENRNGYLALSKAADDYYRNNKEFKYFKIKSIFRYWEGCKSLKNAFAKIFAKIF